MSTQELPKQQEDLDLGHEGLVDAVLEEGRAYQTLQEMRDLETPYEDLSTSEKWFYATEVVENRTGQKYEDSQQLMEDIRSGNLDLIYMKSWGEYAQEYTEGSGQVVVEEPEVAEADTEDRVDVWVSANLEGREDEGLRMGVSGSREDWNEFIE